MATSDTKKIRANPLPSLERVRELFNYNPLTGILTWRICINPAAPLGAVAGCRRPDGQLTVRVDRTSYRVHRIIWLWMTGREPGDQIDHRDTNPSNNRWPNLRETGFSGNAANKRPYCKSGIKGAYFNEQVGRWYSRIRKDGVNSSLGYFDTAEEANAAYAAKAVELFGEFARAV